MTFSLDAARALAACVLVVSATACSDETDVEAEAETVDVRPEAPLAEDTPATEETALPEEATAEPSEPPAEAELDPDGELARLTETLRNASTAAETYESGSTLCEAAHASLVAMMEAVAERYPDQVKPPPPKSAFIQACERLPEEAQECLMPSHAMAHVEDCAAITERLEPEDREYLDAILGG